MLMKKILIWTRVVAKSYIYWTYAKRKNLPGIFASSKNDLATNVPLPHFNIDGDTESERLHKLSKGCDIMNTLCPKPGSVLTVKIKQTSKLWGEVSNY